MKPDGGPAYPMAVDCSPNSRTEYQVGMSLRDRIFISVLPRLLARYGERATVNGDYGVAAREAWKVADVALAERVVEQSDEPAYDPRDCEAADDPR